jgi:DNA repair protein RadA/Sms
MAKSIPTYSCQSCGAVHSKWSGRCDACGEWNSIVEETTSPIPGSAKGAKGRSIQIEDLKGDTEEAPRIISGIGEFDRVCGGGLVPGSALLVGGDPGIGKSTVLLQAMASLAKGGRRTLYISGEEALAQVRLRAQRLGVSDASVFLASATSLSDILRTLKDEPPFACIIIDSIQTVWSDGLESAPGTVAQVRACSQELIRFAKRTGACIVLVGHVTKEGQIAGPRVVEHMVDTVLYFEGERGHQFRILRAVKNRFGPTDEIGVFEMTDSGLKEVANPSALFLSNREDGVPGAAVFAGIEGTRPVLVEIQALLAPTAYGTPRRAVVGWDTGRLSMILAVMEARLGIALGSQDVYLNVAGGLKIREPAADLAVAASLLSSLTETALPPQTIIFGEISLSGAIRPVGHTDARLREAEKLGFQQAFASAESASKRAANLKITKIDSLGALSKLLERA